ncbi:SDR family NAD(P)-dependent oxidoreductase [Aureispira anguillae]|uniref:SDR family NAD(P)-dependent oxidoreductase n=1 Tax=Aureispira anguillae TaxID=2864201 RepID=A0A915YEN0_9BACT|nr:SDR family NAD(P)-dependent oxidoreductase [Aureispira anguillae]BDS11596.1 SDR family NAD(P)-dependent oxidoreductase [Aureispira anguillae]
MIPIPKSIPNNVIVTGGAGFIGSHLVDALLDSGRTITVLDNLSNANQAWLEKAKKRERFNFIEGDIQDENIVRKAMVSQQQVWHLAGNANIPIGIKNTRIDIDSAVYGTRNILDAMVAEGIKDIVFSSTGAVYGNLSQQKVTESSAPLYPLSMYGAGKISAEAFISSYANLFGIRGWIFRFGNVLGNRMSRGAIRDFITRLKEDPTQLTILGDGKQAKSYFLVEDCIKGILWLLDNYEIPNDHQVEIFNLGNTKVTSIITIANYVTKALGLSGVDYNYTGGKIGWPGDQPVVQLDVSKVEKIGWNPPNNSDKAVEIAVERMINYLKE